MSMLTQTATLLAALQDDLERAVARCTAIAGQADEALHAATTMGSATAIGDAEDIQTAVAVLGQHLTRALTTASITADTIRTVIHDDPDN